MLMKSSALGTKELVSLDHSNFLALNFLMKNTVGWSKNPISSQTNKLMAGTKFSDYSGIRRCKKAKKIPTEKAYSSFVMNPKLAFLR